jgi:glycosyltransferase involved in cell wall biosynthesis
MLADSGGGILVPPDDSQQLAGAWWELLHDRDRLQQMGAAGREYVFSRRSGPQMAASTAEVLQQFLPDRKPSN